MCATATRPRSNRLGWSLAASLAIGLGGCGSSTVTVTLTFAPRSGSCAAAGIRNVVFNMVAASLSGDAGAAGVGGEATCGVAFSLPNLEAGTSEVFWQARQGTTTVSTGQQEVHHALCLGRSPRRRPTAAA